MDIYTYFFFSYGLTAAIAFFMVGLILVTNKVLNMGSAKKPGQTTHM